MAQLGQLGQLELPKKDTSKQEDVNAAPRKFAIKTVFLMEDSALFKPALYSHLDTSLNNIDLIDQGLLSGNFYQRINNFGSAAYNLEFNPHRKAGFNLGLNAHRLHNISSKSLQYYNTYTPYTQFRYVQGDGELQILDINHTQSINEYWNFGITYHSLKSSGFYSNEANRLTNVAFHTQYQNQSGNYRLLAYGIWNTSDLNENGGVENVDLFNTPAFGTQIARFSQSSLLDANYWYRNSEIGIRQFRYLGKQDSIKVKGYGNAPVFMPRAYITHKLTYTKNTAKFTTSDTGYFENNYTFINNTFEVVEHREVSNEIGFGLYLNKKEILKGDSNAIDKPYAEQVFYGGVDFRVGRAGFWGLERLTFREPNELVKWWGYGNVHLFANLSKQLTPVTHFKGSLNYVALGSQFSDYETNLAVRQVLFKKLVLSPFLKTEAVSPNFLQNTYVSAYSRWNNDFKKEFNNSLGATLAYGLNTSITVMANRSDNFIYFNTEAKPTQYDAGINYFQVKLNKTFHFGKFHFENEFSWQQINVESPYKVPELLARINYYFQSPMFKQAATVAIGVRAWYYSSFNGLAYLPGLGAFYVQNEMQTGGYPWIDIYLTANIKKWNGFVKYAHVNEGLFGYNYQMLPNYPIAPRALQMGVAWRFYD